VATPQAAPSTPAATPSVPSLRIRGIGVFVGFIVVSLLGNSLALESGGYGLGYLAGHIVVALLLVAFTGHSAVLASRSYRGLSQAVSTLTLVAAIGATIAGTVFLLGGQSNGALYGMEGLAVLGLLGAILMIVWGGAGSLRKTVAKA